MQDERTQVEVSKGTRNELAQTKYALGADNYDQAVSELIEIYRDHAADD